MLIRVEHATSYTYSEPLVSSTQYLRMTPLSGRTKAVESWKLTCPGAASPHGKTNTAIFVTRLPWRSR